MRKINILTVIVILFFLLGNNLFSAPTPTPTIIPGAGIQWQEVTTAAQFSPRQQLACVVFNNMIWVLGGNTSSGAVNDVWNSADGANWNEVTSAAAWEGRDEHKALVYNNQIWIMGGSAASGTKNDVWYSNDGFNWGCTTTAAAWSQRLRMGVVVFNNQMWVMGGESGTGNVVYNDVWYSSDGVNWGYTTTAAAWAARQGLSAVVYNGAMWVSGGDDAVSTTFNDVWSSSDGINWTNATSSAGWAARLTQGNVVFNGRMWIYDGWYEIGGWVYYNDVWYSYDGTAWTEATNSAPWSARNDSGCVVFNNYMWIIAGYVGSGGISNDVWRSPPEYPTATVSPALTATPTFTPTYIISPTITPTWIFTNASPTPTQAVMAVCFQLYKNSPNPFSDGTNMIYALCGQYKVKIKIYTISGELVVELGQQGQPGINSFYWDTKNKDGKGVASGIYIYSVETVEGSRQKQWGKMAVVK